MNQYITSEEAIQLFEKAYPKQAAGAPEIFLDFLRNEELTGQGADFGHAARAVFNAGRVAGIREERAKHRKECQANNRKGIAHTLGRI